MRKSLIVLVLAAAGCRASPPVLAPGEAPALPGLRLPESPRPLAYRVVLELGEGTTGSGAIDLHFDRPASFFWLNATELQVFSATITQGNNKLPARIVPGDQDTIGFAFEREISAGAATLEMNWSGRITDQDDLGVFRDKVGADLYVFTQFENYEARKAVPCFDEPAFKVPWTLSLIVPEGDVAAANTPVVKTTVLSGGKKRIDFAETKPIPSYLLAFVAGPFEVVNLGPAGLNKTPLRIFVPRGDSAGLTFVRKALPEIFVVAENYFGRPYPYEKLDYVTIPRTVSYGAMENVALITAGRTYVVAHGPEQTPQFERRAALIIAHEIAHQWFGNLVTLTWWDDIWLNEAFSSWMEGVLIDRWRPEWTFSARALGYISDAMKLDSLISSRRLRQPIETKDDIQNAFDDITYDKGRAVMRMFEAWIGEEPLRRAIGAYFDEFAHKSATSSDFLRVLSGSTGRDLAASFLSFLDQPGVPVVEARVSCPENSPPVVHLTQSRHLPVGSLGAAEQLWKIPMTLRWDGGKTTLLLEEKSKTIALAGSCPKWLVANENARGYYHVALDRSQLAAFSPQILSLEERLMIIRDASAMVSGGRLQVEEFLQQVPLWIRDPSPYVKQAAVVAVNDLDPLIIPEKHRSAFASWVRRTFAESAAALGLRPAPGDSLEIRILRPVLASLYGTRGDDRAYAAEAKKLAENWLQDPNALEQEMVPAVLRIAAHHGDRTLFDRLKAVLAVEKNPRRREHVIDALASFRDPRLVEESLTLFTSGAVDPREGVSLLDEQDVTVQAVEWAFVKKSYDRLVELLPGETVASLPRFGTRFCDAEMRREVENYFGERVKKILGAPRILENRLEEIALCAALKDAQNASFERFFSISR